MVISDLSDSYNSKKGEKVNTQILSVIDQDPSGHRLIQSVDYTLSENERLAFAGKLLDKRVEIAVKELYKFGDRFRLRGALISVEGKPINVQTTASNSGKA